jgi:DNA excision repair protein ERCC-4
MCGKTNRFYATPVLLVEFSESKAFMLQTRSEIKDTIDLNSIVSKLALLTIAFPNLRLLWSRDAR